MRKIILAFFLFLTFISYSQEPLREIKNDSTFQRQLSFVGELGGNGVFYSVGLEHAKFKNGVLQDTFRYGLSFTPSEMNGNFISAFAEFNTEFGKKYHYLELGAGPTVLEVEVH
jgi:hypothetical protein